MAHDREEDILYLAHQLWEEQASSVQSVHSCWQKAAAEVLSNGWAHHSCRNEACNADPTAIHSQTYLRFGKSVTVEMGKSSSAYRIETITCRPDAEIANPAIFLVRTVGRT